MPYRPPPGFIARTEADATLYGKGKRLQLKVYKRDVVVVDLSRDHGFVPENDRSGSTLDVLSRESMRRLVFAANNAKVVWRSLLTVTYPETWPRDGRVTKKHLAALLQWLRRKYKLKWYLWVREFQERGAPHFHILLDVELNLSTLDRDITYRPEGEDGKPAITGSRMAHAMVSAEWQRIIGEYGSEAGFKAGCRWERLNSENGGAAYLATYFGKEEQKTLPPMYFCGGRWWGYSQKLPGLEEDFSVEVGSEAYFANVEGRLLSADGWLYTVLHNGRHRAWKFLSDVDGGDRPGVGVVKSRRAGGLSPPGP